jgi:hypothetical protein
MNYLSGLKVESEKIATGLFNDLKLDRLADLTTSEYADHEISDLSYLEWEYFNNPAGNAIIAVASAGKQIVAQYVLLPGTYFIDGKLVQGSLSLNTLTHQEYRGRGLFTKLAEETFRRCKEQGVAFTIGIPNPVSHPVFLKKLGFTEIGHLSLLVRPLNFPGLLFRFLKNRSKKFKEGLTIEFDLTVFEKKAFQVSEVCDENDAIEIEDFFRKYNSSKRNAFVRSAAFIHWRYLNVPIRKYNVLKIKSRGNVVGLIVFRTKYLFGLKCIFIIDLCIIPDANSILVEIISDLKLFLKPSAADLVLFATTAHSTEYSLLKKNGFFSVPKRFLPQQLPVIVRKHDDNCPDSVTDFTKWFLTFGDYDVF